MLFPLNEDASVAFGGEKNYEQSDLNFKEAQHKNKTKKKSPKK